MTDRDPHPDSPPDADREHGRSDIERAIDSRNDDAHTPVANTSPTEPTVSTDGAGGAGGLVKNQEEDGQ